MYRTHPYLISGCLILSLTWIFGVESRIAGLRTRVVGGMDSHLYRFQAELVRTIELLGGSTASLDRLERIEARNRALSLSATRCAIPIVQNASDGASMMTTLSLAHGTWIVLAGSSEELSIGDAVLIDSVYLGKISAVFPTYSTMTLGLQGTEAVVLQHVNSAQSGLLRSSGPQSNVAFGKRIDTLQVGDILATIPDGAHTRKPYPIATVTQVVSSQTESVSRVNIAAMLEPTIGKSVRVLRSKVAL